MQFNLYFIYTYITQSGKLLKQVYFHLIFEHSKLTVKVTQLEVSLSHVFYISQLLWYRFLNPNKAQVILQTKDITVKRRLTLPHFT